MLIALTPGEPAGIGPELCLELASEAWPQPLVAIADRELLAQRVRDLELGLSLPSYERGRPPRAHSPGCLPVLHVPLARAVVPGNLDPANAAYVLCSLERAASGCLEGEFQALVTAPVHKGVINDAGFVFSGHTEYLAQLAGAPCPVMLLCADSLRVALATTHLALRDVSAAIGAPRLTEVIEVLARDLARQFGIASPRILVCGLNPHAGEGGHLGREEIDVIAPVLETLRTRGLALQGPVPADTAFTPARLREADAVLAMYHDQGLPVLKYAGFGRAVNVTLGLPFIRTSADHGTALDLAGTGHADSGSLRAAISLACEIAERTGAGP